MTRVVGLTLEAVGCPMMMGDRCLIDVRGGRSVEAEVVGFSEQRLFLMPLTAVQGLQAGALIRPMADTARFQSVTNCLDGCLTAPVSRWMVADHCWRIRRRPCREPLSIPCIALPSAPALDVGIRAINSLLTVGQGQRIGLFAGSGVGKSVLLGMMTRFTSADITVVGLIGERGREVQGIHRGYPVERRAGPLRSWWPLRR
jgi:flagellum-specific ATP synthase